MDIFTVVWVLSMMTQISAQCDPSLSGNSSVLQSPNYPNNYPANYECAQQITVDSGKRVLIQLDSYDLEPSCDRDRIAITEPSGIFMLFCGTGSNYRYVSKTNVLKFYFKSDGYIQKFGYTGRYLSVDPAEYCEDWDCPIETHIVCGSDWVDYDNSCQLHKEGCRTGEAIVVLHEGPCATGGCGPDCSNVEDIVCGTDGRNYFNDCALYKEACLTGTSTIVEKNGTCEIPDPCVHPFVRLYHGCYYFNPPAIGVTWADAKAACENMKNDYSYLKFSSSLAKLDPDNVYGDIRYYLEEGEAASGDYWIGATNVMTNPGRARWHWIDGSRVSLTHKSWVNTEPNQRSSCALMSYTDRYQLIDTVCDGIYNKFGWVCHMDINELPPPPIHGNN